jgi:hypothetical protein
MTKATKALPTTSPTINRRALLRGGSLAAAVVVSPADANASEMAPAPPSLFGWPYPRAHRRATLPQGSELRPSRLRTVRVSRRQRSPSKGNVPLSAGAN